MTISNDLRSLRGIIARRAEPFDGAIYFSATDTANVLALIDSLIGRATVQEGLLYPRQPPLPPDVVDLTVLCRRLRPARPVGGAA